MSRKSAVGKDHPNWLQLAADLVKRGCNKFDAEDIAKDATSHPNPQFRLAQLRDAYRDGAVYAHHVADSITKVMQAFPQRPFDRAFEVNKGEQESPTDTPV